VKLPRVLCVDDEPNVLDGLHDTLRKSFDVVTAESGAEALDLLATGSNFAVIVTDMRMPAMDGATFLASARFKAPDAVRILLTGHADIDAAIAAVNNGNIFRFLTKPCSRETLMRALAAALGQHRLLIAERTILEETLHGTLQAMSETLTLTNPEAFARATRVKKRAGELAREAAVEDVWEIEVAAMLSQIACATLGPETAQKYYYGEPLEPAEQVLVERLPQMAARVIRHIPRLENVHAILSAQNRPPGENTPVGARLLRIAHDFDVLEARGEKTELILASMRGDATTYDQTLLASLSKLTGDRGHYELVEISLGELQLGMSIVDDVITDAGALLFARGQVVTPQLLDRVERFTHVALRNPVRCLRDQRHGAKAA
jgi:CheY-like chemotaxis protein